MENPSKNKELSEKALTQKERLSILSNQGCSCADSCFLRIVDWREQSNSLGSTT